MPLAQRLRVVAERCEIVALTFEGRDAPLQLLDLLPKRLYLAIDQAPDRVRELVVDLLALFRFARFDAPKRSSWSAA